MKKHLPVKLDENANQGALVSDFNRSARSLAKQFGMDVEDIQNAYKSKMVSLTLMDETVREAKSNRGENIFWTIVALAIVPPIALWPGYYIWRNTQRIDTVKDTLKSEVTRNKELTDQRTSVTRPAPKP